jgi:hypothetical protein
MAKKSRDTKFDDGLTSREQDKAIGEALLQMGAPRSKAPRRMARILVWGFVLLMPLSLGLGFIIADNNRSLNNELTQALTLQNNPGFKVRYDDMGAEVISAWYNRQKPPIDIDSTIQWTEPLPANLSGENKTAASNTPATTGTLKVSGISFLRGSQIETKGNPGRYEERLEYYVLLNGVPQIIGVTIAIPNLDDLNSTPVLLSAPSVIGKPTVSAISDDKLSTPVEALGNAQLTDAAKSVLNAWAEAWTEDNASALKQTTQDSNVDNIYRGLGGGWTYTPDSLTVQWSALAPEAGGNAVARVSWEMQTPGTVIPATTGENAQPERKIPGAKQKQSMDVLIGKFETGTPSVLAWGQAGTYLELKAQANALSKEEAAKLAPAAPANPADADADDPATTPTDAAQGNE